MNKLAVPAPDSPQMQFMSDKLRGAPMQGAAPAPDSPQMQFMSNKLRGAPPVALGAPKMMGGMKKGGKVSSASSRADGIAQRGKTRGKMC
jgi:hypothetical protein